MRHIKELAEHSIGIKLCAHKTLPGRHACEGCLAGKQKESFAKKTDSRQNIKDRKLHSDTSDILTIPIRGFRYFLLTIDDATRFCWVKLLKNKDEDTVFPALMEVVTHIETSTGDKVAVVRSDNGKGEFGKRFQSMLLAKGIAFEPCPPYKQSMNGVSERYMDIIKTKMRSMQYAADLPMEFWDFACEHAVWIKNRVVTAALPFGLDGKIAQSYTPYEAWNDRLPNFEKLRVFGCAGWPLVPNTTKRHTLDPRIKPDCIFVGMKGSKIWKFFNMLTKVTYEYADADFDEYSFTYNSRMRGVDSLAPKLPPAQLPKRRRPARNNVRFAETGAEAEAARDTIPDPHTQPGRTDGSSADVEELKVSRDKFSDLARDPKVFLDAITSTTRSSLSYGKGPTRNVFSSSVVQAVIAMKAVHLDSDESTSIGVPTPPMEAVDLEDALKSGDALEWKKALLSELKSLQKMNTFKIMWGEPPSGRKLISTRWVLRRKFNSKMQLARRKARLVARGFEQSEGIDYFETFASVMRYCTFRVLAAHCAANDLEMDHVDIDTAFLNEDLEEDVYTHLPRFITDIFPELKGKRAYLKLRKSLYGLKQASAVWLKAVKEFFKSIGLESSDAADPNLFVGRGVMILLFVDDMLICGKKEEVAKVKKEILEHWDGKDLGPVDTFVGFEVERDRVNKKLRIHQSSYTTRILQRFGMDKCNPATLPFPAGTVLRKNEDEEPLDRENTTVYRQIVGSLIYLSNNTRPDISYAVGQLARFMQSPTMPKYMLCKQLLRYLSGTRTVGITYSKCLGVSSSAYNVHTVSSAPSEVWTDATWATEDDRKSVEGMAHKRYGGLVNWASVRQKSTALASMDSEIMAGCSGAKKMA